MAHLGQLKDSLSSAYSVTELKISLRCSLEGFTVFCHVCEGSASSFCWNSVLEVIELESLQADPNYSFAGQIFKCLYYFSIQVVWLADF